MLGEPRIILKTNLDMVLICLITGLFQGYQSRCRIRSKVGDKICSGAENNAKNKSGSILTQGLTS